MAETRALVHAVTAESAAVASARSSAAAGDGGVVLLGYAGSCNPLKLGTDGGLGIVSHVEGGGAASGNADSVAAGAWAITAGLIDGCVTDTPLPTASITAHSDRDAAELAARVLR